MKTTLWPYRLWGGKNWAVLALIIMTSCSSRTTEIDIFSFEHEIALYPIKAEFHGKELIYPNSITIVDSTLILIERSVSSGIVNVYSLHDFEIKNSFGVRGRGPDEFSDIIQHIISITGSETPSIHILDWINKRLSDISIDSSYTGQTQYTRQFILPPELMLVQRAAFLNDTTVICMGGIYRGLMAFVDVNTDATKYIEVYPFKSNQISIRQMAEVYRGEFAINHKNQSIAVASKWIPEILITDFSGKIRKNTSFMEYNIDNIALLSEDDRVLHYKDIKATENFIYAVYIGKSYNELLQVMDHSDNSSTPVISEIHVFDWEGFPVTRYILNDGFYQFIEIDKLNNRFFAIDVSSPDRSIVYFNVDNNL